MVFFGEERDWKEDLCDDIKIDMAELLEIAKRNRCAYMQAEDVKVAQLWVALAEVYKHQRKLESRLEKVEAAIKAISQMGEAAKRDALRKKIVDTFKAKTPEEKETVEKIVDTLMEF
ncbi:MAG: hypothetical protein N3D75_02070 [Candidatus Aenigmarchaeota archaeon]|nr:hypothetical protein [Candidatus Aenigmarchaeota archaeon]